MKKHWIRKKNELLDKWLERVADYWHFGEELREVLREVSKESKQDDKH